MELKKLFKFAYERKASDLHLIVGIKPVLRINGELFEIQQLEPITQTKIKEFVNEILNKEQKERFFREKDYDLSYELKSQDCRFRINLYFESNNISLAARVIPKKIPSLEDILMPEIVYKLLDKKQGLILVTGPTGCGKSTSLAAMINYINQTRKENIITLEDPIEFIFQPIKSIITQRQLNIDMLSFDAGLKHVLRQDPNIIMVGEMRDLKTIATTITLAETGHSVLATLHTYSAAQTIDRIIDSFPPYQQTQIRMQLSSTLAAVISQRLLPMKGGGRIAAREIMTNNPAISNMIREDKIAQIRTSIETSSNIGMTSMDQDLKRLYAEGKITKESARSYMLNPESLEN